MISANRGNSASVEAVGNAVRAKSGYFAGRIAVGSCKAVGVVINTASLVYQKFRVSRRRENYYSVGQRSDFGADSDISFYEP